MYVQFQLKITPILYTPKLNHRKRTSDLSLYQLKFKTHYIIISFKMIVDILSMKYQQHHLYTMYSYGNIKNIIKKLNLSILVFENLGCSKEGFLNLKKIDALNSQNNNFEKSNKISTLIYNLSINQLICYKVQISLSYYKSSCL